MCVCVGADPFFPSLSALFLLPRFTVRDFQYNEEEMKADKEEMTRLSTDKKKQFVRWHFNPKFSLPIRRNRESFVFSVVTDDTRH